MENQILLLIFNHFIFSDDQLSFTTDCLFKDETAEFDFGGNAYKIM